VSVKGISVGQVSQCMLGDRRSQALLESGRMFAHSRGLDGNGNGRNPVDSAGIETDVAGIAYCEDGNGSCGNPAGTEFVLRAPRGDAL